MCGIVAIIDKKDVSYKLFLGLISLQHRGQDTAGIITNKEKELFIKKGTGIAQDIFNNKNLETLKGNLGIAQTRYTTIGKPSINNSQPLFLNSSNKIAMAHNGNITNYLELKEKLAKKGIFLTTTVDIEPVLHLFAIKYEQTKDFFKAANYVFKNVKGSYSIVGIIAGKGIFAIRDPRGIRPLVFGKKKESFVFASESVTLQTINYNYVKDVNPGEAIFINNKTLKVESKILLEKAKSHCMFEWIYFSRPESMIEKRSVYKARLALGIILAERLKKEDIDVVIPVPDGGRSYAIRIAEVLGIKYREGLIKNKYIGRTFIMQSKASREKFVNLKLNPIISIIKNKNVLVVDDSIVRATTSKRIVKLLKKAGAKKVIFVSSCPPIKYPCFYGIDMSNKQELIAHNKSIEEIRKYIGADKLIYSKVEDVKKAIRRDICTACLNGRYSIKLSKKEKDFFEKDSLKRLF